MNTILSACLNGFAASIPLLCAVWIVLRLSRRWLNAPTRYAVWWIALLTVIALPVLYLPVRQAPIAPPIRRTPAVPAVVISAPPIRHLASVGPAIQPMPVRKRSWPMPITAGLWPVRFLQLWTLAAMLMALRLVVSYALLHRQKARATDASDSLARFVESSL